MRISDILKTNKVTVSCEMFPPKPGKPLENTQQVVHEIAAYKPSFMSVTYGAGGSNSKNTLSIAEEVQKSGVTALAHLTCVGQDEENLRASINAFKASGIENILALRGDIPFGWTGTHGDLHYATELVAFVRKNFGDKFTVAVAGSPEGHIACRSLDADISFLKQKQDEGADYIMTQLCWDMDAFRYWLEAIRNAGIWLPVDVGIMPILDQAATINMALSRNGCVMDRKLCEIISKNWIFPNPFDKEPFDADVAGKKESFRKAGIEYTINQIDEYRACGIDGIHLYALNKFDDVARIVKESGIVDPI